MSNMSYCRFQNTVGDLRDCYDALGEKDISELSAEEEAAAKRLIKLCKRIADDYADDIDAG